MKSFDKFKVTLKTKWLDYYQTNRDWIVFINDKNSLWHKWSNGAKRPNSNFILGAMTALEPKLAELIYLFRQVNCNTDNIIEGLGLNFDPDKAIEQRELELAATQEVEIVPSLTDTDTEYLNRLREENIT